MSTDLAVPGKLTIGSDGKLRGPANITYNAQWPCPNSKAGVTGKMRGVVEHTMVGFIQPTIDLFNTPGRNASAHLALGQNGRIHQFVPFGEGYETYHAYAANTEFYGFEFEDFGNTLNPISPAAIVAGAQALECLSEYAEFPLQVMDDCAGEGFGYHSLCSSWNLDGHTCPGPGPRASQRADMVALAKQIRAGETGWADYTTNGTLSLLNLARSNGTMASTVLRKTIEAHGSFSAGLVAYINKGDLTAVMPAGLVVQMPAAS